MRSLHYFVYIITNPKKTVLYTGVTNDLEVRLEQHYQNRGNKSTFTGKYHCYKLLYFEIFSGIEQAIAREKEIKGWTRAKKNRLLQQRIQIGTFWKLKDHLAKLLLPADEFLQSYARNLRAPALN